MTKRAWLAGLASMALASGLLAQGPGPRPAPRGDLESQLKERIGLADEQVEQVRKLRVEHQKAEVQRQAALQVARMELNELFRAPMVDEKAIAAKLKVVGDLEFAVLKARVDQRLALRKVVSPEQAEQIEKLAAVGARMRAGQGARAARKARPGGPRQD
ncbi:MAG: periplasmic heavy metal sensor [Vicinamibacteria bacterium]|nr:periplasmic heavy metal sensor [Vicinamibacteria bacterium]